MGFVQRCSVGRVKQPQSRAPPDAMGTSGFVSLRLRAHAHMPTYYYEWHWYTHKKTLSAVRTRTYLCLTNTYWHRECFNSKTATFPPRAGQISKSCEWVFLQLPECFGLYWLTSTCLIHPNYTGTHRPLIGDVCGLHPLWTPLLISQNPSFIPWRVATQCFNSCLFMVYWFTLFEERAGVCVRFISRVPICQKSEP